MTRERLSITRSQATRRPEIIRPVPHFYEFNNKQILATLTNTTDEMPAGIREIKVVLDGKDPRIPKYKIIGGFDQNCVQILLPEKLLKSDHHQIEWVCLLTFTGFQFKYVYKNSKNKLLFALADEDAYCYCDSDPCAECRFKCKNGFSVFAYWRDEGIFGKSISPFRKLTI